MRYLLLIGALLVSGCDRSSSRICGSLPAQLPGVVPKTADDQMQVTAYCVEHWAARLAGGPDVASEVVEAVIGACDGAIVALDAAKTKEVAGSEISLGAARNYWRKRAQFIVVQTRAGNCYPDA